MCKPVGTMYDPDRFSRGYREQERYNRDEAAPSWATLALHEGIDIKTGGNLHTTRALITWAIYTHVTPPMQSDATERWPDLILGSQIKRQK